MSALIPIVNAPNLYINGLAMAWVDTTHITVAPGRARDSSDTNDIILDTIKTINVRNNGALGLDTGTLAPNTFYAVYLVADSTAYKDPTVLISTSITTPLLPLGYDMFRRVGMIKTNATAAPNTLVLQFWQTGLSNDREMWYDLPISVLAATAGAAFAAVSLATAVPAVVGQTKVRFNADLLPNAPAAFVELRPTGGAAAAGNVKMSGDVAAVHHFDQLEVVAAISAGVLSVDWITDAVSTVQLSVTSYVDNV